VDLACCRLHLALAAGELEFRNPFSRNQLARMHDPNLSPNTIAPGGRNLESLKDLTTVLYILYAVSIFVGITFFVAIIINYVKKDDVAGTWLESHFRWQIRTFWASLLWALLGGIAWLLLIGWLVWLVAGVWYIYRIVKGWLYLNDGKPMYQ
jgi:uncharacterized membrane protein